jgi:quercetin 2,3-dioxygenase
MKTIKQIHTAISAPIDDLVTYRAMPTHSVNHIDPFLFLNHHGPQVYGRNNRGLPFGPHPHRGFETLTFIIKGDIVHKDSGGHQSVITAGGIQWMTAGSGVIHSEVSSEEFKKNGGDEEVLQLWLNLPAKLKMTPPKYTGLQYAEIPHLAIDGGRVIVNLISGEWGGTMGPVISLTELTMCSIDMKTGGQFDVPVAASRNMFFYVVKGKVQVNGKKAQMYNLVEFANDGEEISVQADEDSLILFGHGQPFNEPIVAYGPFVMNTDAEIRQAFKDYQEGKFGNPNAL